MILAHRLYLKWTEVGLDGVKVKKVIASPIYTNEFNKDHAMLGFRDEVQKDSTAMKALRQIQSKAPIDGIDYEAVLLADTQFIEEEPDKLTESTKCE